MQQFILIWLGQLISTVGSQLTSFTLGILVYQKTGLVSQFAIVLTLIYLPGILISPVSGVLIDRWKPRLAMIVSDVGAAIGTLLIILLASIGELKLWQIYGAIVLSSIFSALQWSAYATTISQIVPKSYLNRANGMVEISKAAAKLIAPFTAGLLLAKLQLRGVLTLDLISFCISLLTLFIVRFSRLKSQNAQQPETSEHSASTHALKLKDFKIAWVFIISHPILSKLMLLFFYLYLTLGILEAVTTPLILSFASPAQLGMVLSLGGCGWLLGSVIASLWKGPKQRIKVILGFMLMQGFWLFLGGLRPSLALAAIGISGYLFAYPFISIFNQTIWQLKVPVSLQGRVFAVRLMGEWLALPIGYLLTGFLVDQIFEPLLLPGGSLAATVGQIIGIGAGRGIGLLFVVVGILTILVAIVYAQFPQLRLVEDDLAQRV